jgi:hypothetical protein
MEAVPSSETLTILWYMLSRPVRQRYELSPMRPHLTQIERVRRTCDSVQYNIVSMFLHSTRKLTWFRVTKQNSCRAAKLLLASYEISGSHDVSEVLALHRPPTNSPDDGDGKHLWNVVKILPDCTVQQPRRQ